MFDPVLRRLNDLVKLPVIVELGGQRFDALARGGGEGVAIGDGRENGRIAGSQGLAEFPRSADFGLAAELLADLDRASSQQPGRLVPDVPKRCPDLDVVRLVERQELAQHPHPIDAVARRESGVCPAQPSLHLPVAREGE